MEVCGLISGDMVARVAGILPSALKDSWRLADRYVGGALATDISQPDFVTVPGVSYGEVRAGQYSCTFSSRVFWMFFCAILLK